MSNPMYRIELNLRPYDKRAAEVLAVKALECADLKGCECNTQVEPFLSEGGMANLRVCFSGQFHNDIMLAASDFLHRVVYRTS